MQGIKLRHAKKNYIQFFFFLVVGSGDVSSPVIYYISWIEKMKTKCTLWCELSGKTNIELYNLMSSR